MDPELLPVLELPPMEDPLPLVLGLPEVLEPVVPPLVEPPPVEPVCANAAPAASIETIANRFHHVFMRSSLRLTEDVRRPPEPPNLRLRVAKRNGSPRRSVGGWTLVRAAAERLSGVGT
jgi:hypothetical protein